MLIHRLMSSTGSPIRQAGSLMSLCSAASPQRPGAEDVIGACARYRR